MKCKNCGTDLEIGSKFCGSCGAKVDEISNVQPVNNQLDSQPINNQMNSVDVQGVNSVNPSQVNTINQPSSMSSDNSSSKSKKIILPIVVLFILVCVFGGVYLYFKNPKRIITSVINGGYDKLEGLLLESNSFDYEKDSILVKGNLTFDTNIPELADLKSENFSYSVGFDYPNKKMSMGVSLYEEGNRLIDALIYFLNNEGYISLGDDYPSLIKMNSDDTDFSEVFSIEKSKILSILLSLIRIF